LLKKTLSISVRDLVEYTLRTGDLNLTFFGADRPAQAIRAHQAIQESRPEEYSAEVTIRHQVETDKYMLNISGRIDGIYKYPRRVVIDEIKTTRKPLEVVREEDNGVHWGQVKCYAYMYAAQNDLDKIDVQLTYFQVEQNKTAEILHTFNKTELKDFFDSLIIEYLAWADRITKWIELRDRTIGGMKFPFGNYRPGQDKMIEKTAMAIEERGALLIQAPTGIGKTMAVIFPAVQAMAQGLARKVFFLTARTTGRNAAEQSLEVLKENGLRIKYLSLTAKEKVCFNTEKSCNGEECVYARGFYDRINEALRDAFDQDDFTRNVVLRIARNHKICPFEFSLELSLWVDCIICDYNYVFDPRVYLRRFFEDGDSGYVLLVDESHNLVDRSREMYSATLHKEQILALRRRLRASLPGVYHSLGKVNSWLVKARKEMPENETTIAREECPADLCQHLRKFTQAAEQWLARNIQEAFRQDLLDFYFESRRFLSTAERYGTNYATCFTKAGKDFSVKLFCVDPSPHLRAVLERSSAAIFFSATLSPVQYFMRLFGCGDDARSLSLPSPFPSEHLCVMIAGKISALYKHREFTKYEVARMISALIDQKKGNYLIFFPSYEYMRMIHEIFQKRRPCAHIIVQNRKMSEQDREQFLAHFDQRADGYLTGFAVMGGFFAESIDLVGERLAGAAVVGVGFPQISLEREIIKAYFDNMNGSGFAFAYQVPGMIKVLQAAGRVIRSEEDRGVVMLIDTRYAVTPYRLMLPDEWRPTFVDNVEKVGTVLQKFWEW
jgi:DNA excision repair protein ERCC-2